MQALLYLERTIIYLSTTYVKLIILAYSVFLKNEIADQPVRNCSSSFSVGLPRSACAVVSIVRIYTISYQPHRWLSQSLPKCINRVKVQLARPKAKLSKRKNSATWLGFNMPRGSQSLSVGYHCWVSQICWTHPKKMKPKLRLVLPQIARVIRFTPLYAIPPSPAIRDIWRYLIFAKGAISLRFSYFLREM